MPNQFGGYSFIEVAQGKPEADKAEREARLAQIRAGTRQQEQVNEGRELDLRKRRKLAESGGVDDKDVQRQGLIADFNLVEEEGKARRQPGQQQVVDQEQAGIQMDSKMRNTATMYGAYKLGFKKEALKMLSESDALATGVKFTDMSVEDFTDESGKVVKDAKGKPVKMFVMTPEGKDAKPIRLPLAQMERNWQQFGARYQVVDGNLMRIGADGQVQRLFTAPHTSVSPETGQFYDQRQPPPAASAGTGVNPRRVIAGEKHLDDRVKQLDSEFRYFLTGSNTFANMDKETQTRYDKLMAMAGPKVRAGMDPEQARNEAIAQDKREQALKAPEKSAPQRGADLTYQGPRPWLPGYDEGGIVNFDDQGGIGTGEEEKKKKWKPEEGEAPGDLPYMIPMPPVPRVVQYARGGLVRGPGGKDNVPAVVDGKQPVALTSGEGVLNKAAVAIVGEDFVTRLNKAALNITRPTRR